MPSSPTPFANRRRKCGPPVDDSTRKRLVELLEKHVTRDADVRRIKPLIAELKNGTAAKSTEKNIPPPSEHKQAAAATAKLNLGTAY